MRKIQIAIAVLGTLLGASVIAIYAWLLFPLRQNGMSERIENHPLIFISGIICAIGYLVHLKVTQILGERIKTIRHYDRIMADLIVYATVYQQMNPSGKGNSDDIVTMINGIPNNRGSMQNGIPFDGNFDFLLINRGLLSEQADLFKEINTQECSLSDFLIFMKNNFSEDIKKGKYIRNHSLGSL